MSRKVYRIILLLIIDIIIYVLIERAISLLNVRLTNTLIPFGVRFTINSLIVYTWITILLKKDYNAYDVSWLILIAVAPIWGFILFLSIAKDFRYSRRYKKRPLLKNDSYLKYDPESNLNELGHKYEKLFKYTSNVTKHSVFKDNSDFKLLSTGKTFYDELFDKIRNANKFVFLQFYIFKTDAIGRKLIELLVSKAKEGVEVKVLYDYFGGQDFDRKYYKYLENNGVDVHIIDKFILPILNTKINYRNHRKNVIIDGKFGFTGGFNIGDEHFGTVKYKWRDTNLLVSGSIVKSMTALFARDYYYVTNSLLEDKQYYIDYPVKSPGYSQLLQSGPDTEPIIRNTYIKMINIAQKSVKITTPYLGLESEMLLALTLAAKSGVDVSVLIPEIPDKKSVYRVTESFIDDLLRNNIKVYKLKDSFVHAKILIIDDEVACCGTYNLDVRSALINFENTILLYNSTAKQLAVEYDEDIKNSILLDLDTWEERNIFQNFVTEIFKIFTPIT